MWSRYLKKKINLLEAGTYNVWTAVLWGDWNVYSTRSPLNSFSSTRNSYVFFLASSNSTRSGLWAPSSNFPLRYKVNKNVFLFTYYSATFYRGLRGEAAWILHLTECLHELKYIQQIGFKQTLNNSKVETGFDLPWEFEGCERGTITCSIIHDQGRG
jgi:hypothetical protein